MIFILQEDGGPPTCFERKDIIEAKSIANNLGVSADSGGIEAIKLLLKVAYLISRRSASVSVSVPFASMPTYKYKS